MLNISTSQLLYVEKNKDILDKFDLIRSTSNNTQLKEKYIKETFSLFAHKISQSLNNNDLPSIQNIVLDKSKIFTDMFKVYDWPSLDKKSQERLNKRTNFYYDLIRLRNQINHKKLPIDNLKANFEFYRNYLNMIADEEEITVLLNPELIYQIFNDFSTCYKKLIPEIFLQDELYKEIKDDYWEMPNFITESIDFPTIDELSIKENIIKENNLLNLFSNTFKSKCIEAELEQTNDKPAAINKIIKKTQFDNRLISSVGYTNFFKNKYPLLYLDISIIRVIILFLDSTSNDQIFELINDLSKIIEETENYIKFLRSDNQQYQNIITTMKSIMILLIISLTKDTNTARIKEIFSYLSFNCNSENTEGILRSLEFPFISEFSSLLIEVLNSKALTFNQNAEKEIEKILIIENKLLGFWLN